MKTQNKIKPAVSPLFRSCLVAAILLLPPVFTNGPGATTRGQTIQISVLDSAPSIFLEEDQQNPHVISLPDKGKWFVVWEDWRNWNTTGSDIYGRFINSDGSLCGNEVLITDSPGNQTVPHAAYRNGGPHSASSDLLMVVWQDSRGDGDEGYVYYKALDITSLGGTCSVNASAASETPVGYTQILGDSLLSRYLPKVSYDLNRDLFWIVWVEGRNRIQRYARRPFANIGFFPQDPTFDPASVVRSWNTGDISYTGYIKINAADLTVASNAMGTSLPEVMRNDFDTTMRSISGNASITFSDGTSTADVTETWEFFTSVNNVTVASDTASAETLIAWEGIRHELKLEAKLEEKKEEILQADGTSFEPPQYSYHYEVTETFTISANPSDGRVHIYAIFDKIINIPTLWSQQVDAAENNSYYPSVAADPVHRKFLVTWEDRGTFANSKIFGQMVYTGGGLYKNNFIISTQDLDKDGTMDSDVESSDQTRSHVAYDTANQRFFVTWQDGRNSTLSLENMDIFGQYVESEATLRGNNFAITSAPANQLNPVTSFDSATHKFLTVWKDSRNINETNSDIFGLPFTLDLGVPLEISPTSLEYGKIIVNRTKSKTIELTNGSISSITLVDISTGSELFVVEEPAPGTVIPPGASITAEVSFNPLNPGSYEDALTITTTPEEFVLTIPLTGTAVTEEEGDQDTRPPATETTTADSSHPLSIDAKTDEPGRIYILRMHDPLDSNRLSALQRDGSYVDFPYGTDNGWQNLYYAVGLIQAETTDMGTVDLRGKPGVLYTASFVKDPLEDPGPFDFETGLIELRTLVIRQSPGGTWIVSDTVMDSRGEPMVLVHPDPLVILDNGETVTASWGSYNPTIEYIAGTGYNIVFSVNDEVFTYTLQNISENSFTGVMSSFVDGNRSPVYTINGTRSGF